MKEHFLENVFLFYPNQYPKDAMWKILNHDLYYQVSCDNVFKSFKKSTRFVCLVLTGVRVANFFNIMSLDLNFFL